MDNASSHGANLFDPRSQVDVYYLPPNGTACQQPMDIGVIALLKKKYKFELLSLILELLDEKEALRNAVKHWKAGKASMKVMIPIF